MKKKVIILGARGALGQGITKVLLEKKYDHYYLADFNVDGNESRDNITWLSTGDLSAEGKAEEVFSKAETDEATLCFLYSTIGGYTGGKELPDVSESDILKMMNMNYIVSFNILREFSKLVKKSLGGSAVFTTALTSLNPQKGVSAYGSSKAALNYLIKSAAEEGKSYNMSVNAIAPYILDTPANREWLDKEQLPHVINTEEAGLLVHSLYENFHFVTGNIIELSYRFNLIKKNN